MSDDEAPVDGGLPSSGFPTAAAGDTVDFGWADDDNKNKKLSGRRKKLQKKIRPGSFGERRQTSAGLCFD
jgi:hypothetical protein